MYLIIIVVALFVGFTTYYAIQNKENISLVGVSAGGSIYVNKGEYFDLPIKHDDPYKSTLIDEDLVFSDASVLSYNKESKTFYAEKAGVTNVVITPTNKNFGPFTFDVYVGDVDSADYPYFITTAEELKAISSTATKHYQLKNDIDLRALDNGAWTPISSFKGTLNGNGYAIKNMNVVATGEKAGLFANLEDTAKVEDIVFENAKINGSYAYAGIVAGTSTGFIGKCYLVNGEIVNTLTSSYTGGIAGKLGYKDSKAKIQMCESSGLSITSAGLVGGVVGEINAGVAFDSSADVKFSGAGKFAGVAHTVSSVTSGTIERISIIKNCLATISTEALDVSSTVTGIVSTNIKATTQENAYISNYYNSDETLIAVVGLTPVTDAQMKSLTDAELKVQSNYVNWEFESVWLLNDGDAYAHLDFDAYFRNCSVYEYSKYINSVSDFNDVMEMIRNGDSGEFVVGTDLTIDLEGADWQMIPKFDGKITAEEGKTLTIKNFNIIGNNKKVAMFGELSGVLENITIENVAIDNSETHSTMDIDTYCGVLVASNTGEINNCKINGLNLKFTGAFLGGLVGANNGIISNCLVNVDYTDEHTTILCTNERGHAAGLVGYNLKYITNCTVGNVVVKVPDSLKQRHMAGLVALSSGKIENCKVDGAELLTTGQNEILAGGLVGQLIEEAELTLSYAKAIITLNTNDSNSKAGGLVSRSGAKATVLGCASQCSITAYNIGGLVETNYGAISQSYTDGGRLKGLSVGGLTNQNCDGGNVKNCYTTQTLEGYKDSAVVAGFTVALKKGSNIDHCFSAVTFAGLGTKYAESRSEFRMPLAEQFWEYPRVWINDLLESINKREEVGTLTNCAITNYGNAKIQYKSELFKTTDSTFLSLSDDDFLQGNYQEKLADHGFDIAVWTGVSGTVIVEGEATASSYYPTLTNAYKVTND